jgi:2,4-diketo-3-deoxy-L-fuconate hydrolase
MATETSSQASNGARRFGLAAAEVDGLPTVVLVVGARVHCLQDLMPAGVAVPDRLDALLANWLHWHPIVRTAASEAMDATPTVVPSRWLVPVRPRKLICVGVNYRDHLREMGGAQTPDFPYTFLKPVSTGLVASGSAVILPVGPKMIDWEAELAVVMGAPLHRGHGPDVLDAVAGYTVYNDLSARDWIATTREPGIDWVMMKAYDGFSPIGPLITPREFVADPQDLPIRCWVNGELKQDSSTAEMIFGVQAILEHLSGIMTLEPGDVIATGTPAGVGFGAVPQQFLKPGDTVTVEIAGLGRLETFIVNSSQGASA